MPPRPKLEIDTRRAHVLDDQGEAKGMVQAIALFNESLRRTGYRDPLREIDKLLRVKTKKGSA